MMPLPVDTILAELEQALEDSRNVVLQAPPGAGKTTRVPPALLTASWLAGKRLVLLEPRRLAARRAADHMARLMGQEVGRTVGYRVRLDSRVGPETRIEVVTEGVLTRLVQRD
ncbi:MAG: ATP-dependent helicase HrpB, partial [Desulfobacteraceae bacterium]